VALAEIRILEHVWRRRAIAAHQVHAVLAERVRQDVRWLRRRKRGEVSRRELELLAVDARGRHAVDPTRALILAPGDPFTIRHPAGPDTCLSIRGPIVAALAERGSRHLPIDASTHAAITSACRAGDAFALAEALASLDPDEPEPDRDLAHALAHELRLRFADPAPLSEIAAAAHTTVFHACHVFRRTTGTTLHSYRREVRLRHALAMLIDSDQ
jgi:AraC-like DNA-binding protein